MGRAGFLLPALSFCLVSPMAHRSYNPRHRGRGKSLPRSRCHGAHRNRQILDAGSRRIKWRMPICPGHPAVRRPRQFAACRRICGARRPNKKVFLSRYISCHTWFNRLMSWRDRPKSRLGFHLNSFIGWCRWGGAWFPGCSAIQRAGGSDDGIVRRSSCRRLGQ